MACKRARAQTHAQDVSLISLPNYSVQQKQKENEAEEREKKIPLCHSQNRDHFSGLKTQFSLRCDLHNGERRMCAPRLLCL